MSDFDNLVRAVKDKDQTAILNEASYLVNRGLVSAESRLDKAWSAKKIGVLLAAIGVGFVLGYWYALSPLA